MPHNKPQALGCSLALAVVGAGLLAALGTRQATGLSLISEKCDPSKVGPDETTVKGGWQAEMFNGLSFRTCDKSCMPEANRNTILGCFKKHSQRAYGFYMQCTQNGTLICNEQNKQELHFCLASLSQSFVQQEKCGQILNAQTVECLSSQLTDQIELCFIKENVHRQSAAGGQHSPPPAVAAPGPVTPPSHPATPKESHAHKERDREAADKAANAAAASAVAGAAQPSQQQQPQQQQVEVFVQSPKPARAFLKQFEYANYDSLRHACDPELEFDQQITSQEMTEIQAFYTIASTLCRDECLPAATKKQMRECLTQNSPLGAKVFAQCTSQFGQACTSFNEESLTSCFNTIAQNMTMHDKCVELVSDDTQKCWSALISNETTHCVERKNLQTVSFEYGKVCNSPNFVKRPKEEQNQISLAHKTNQENLLRRALEIMCFPNCVSADQRSKMTKCLEKESPIAHQIYANCSKQSKIKCDMDENIEVYAEYVNCIYTEADHYAKSPERANTCSNLITPSSFKCLESLYPNEIFYCPDVKVFHEAQAEAISHHAASSQLEEYEYENS